MARDRSIDAVGGIMILLVIYRHCLTATASLGSTLVGSAITYYPLLFYMAWFFFKSGMYFKGSEPLEESIKKGTIRLLVPYLCFSAIAIAVSLVLNGVFFGSAGIHKVLSDIPLHLKREGAVVCDSPLWFLLSLFFVRVFFSAANRLHIPAWCPACVSLVAAFGLYRMDLPIGLYFENIALGLFFYSMGYVFKEIQYKKAFFIASAIVYVAFLIYCFVTKNVVSEFVVNTHTPYLPTVLFCLFGCILVNNLSKRLNWGSSRFLSTIGADSMTYYVTHFIIIYSVLTFDKATLHLSDWPLFLLLVISVAVLLPLLAKLFARPRLKWMTGDAAQNAKARRLSPLVAWAGTLAVTALMVSYLALQMI